MSPVVLISVLAQALTPSAGASSEVRLRGGQSGTSVDLVTSGRLALALSSTRVNWGLAYAPTLTLFNFGGDNSTTVIQHGGTLQASFTLSPRTYVYVAETATYGERYMQLMTLVAQDPLAASPASTTTNATTGSTTNATTGSTTPTTAGSTSGSTGQTVGTSPTGTSTNLAVPRSATIRYGSTDTSAGVTYRLNPGWRALARVGYGISGGLDDRSRESMPSMQWGSTGVSLNHSVSRSDQAALNADASSTVTALTQVERQAYIVSLVADWMHAFTPRTSAGLSAGVSYTWLSTTVFATTPIAPFPIPLDAPYAASQLRGSGDDASLYPVTSASFRTMEPLREGRLSVTLWEQIYPYVDRMTGNVRPRSATAVNATWTRRRFRVAFGGDALTALDSARETNTLQRSLSLTQSVTYSLRRHWQFQFGVRQMWMSFANVDTPMMWNSYIAATYTTSNRPML